MEEFAGQPVENTWHTGLAGGMTHPQWGQGRVLIETNGEPVALVWGMVGDFLVHAPTPPKCHKAFSAFVDHLVQLGIICQKTKTSPLAQKQNFCGMLPDSTTIPCVLIREAKIFRSLATIEYVKQAQRGALSRLALVVATGLL
jgi:hypothetical protein